MLPGLWVTLDSPAVTEMAVALGLDWVVIDAEHGQLDWQEVAAHVRASVRSDTVCLVRLESLDVPLVKRALDVGADGFVIPNVETPEQVRLAVRAAAYPPAGVRGIGAERATVWGKALAEHAEEADPIVVPLLESPEAGRNACEMAGIDGAGPFFVGPADWSAVAGYPGRWHGPGVAEQIDACVRAVRAAGKTIGVVARSPEDLRVCRAQGFRMIGLGLDAALLMRSAEAMLLAAGRASEVTTAFVARAAGSDERPLRSVPPALATRARLSPARPATEPVALDDRVSVSLRSDYRIGSWGLTTAQVDVEPGGGLVPHAHPVPETVFCLEGEVTTNVDGREWVMRPGDTLRIPAGAAHQTGNASTTAAGRIFVMLPSAQITRTLVDVAAAKRMDRDAQPPKNAERVALDATAELAPGEIRRVMPGLAVTRVAGATADGRSDVERGTTPGTVCECDRVLYGVSGSASVRTPEHEATIEAGGSLFVPAGVPARWVGDAEKMATLLVAYEIEDATELAVDASLFGGRDE